MTNYRQYAGHAVSSILPIAALPAYSGLAQSPVTLTVLLSVGDPEAKLPAPLWLHEWRGTDGNVSLQLASLEPKSSDDPCGFLLRVPGQCDFDVDPASGTIFIRALKDCAPNTLEHLVIDQVLPRLLAQRGHLMVHASLVRIGSGAALFLGNSGWGKSTLAGLLHRHGHAALCDDCALLELRDGETWATPAYPGMRLYEDSIEQVFDGLTESSPVAEYSSKQRVISLPLSTELSAPHSLRAIYLLGDPQHANHEIAIQPLTSAAACMGLIEHSFRLNPTAKDQTVHFLRQAGAIAQATPAFSLRHPHDFASQDRLIRRLLEHVERNTRLPA